MYLSEDSGRGLLVSKCIECIPVESYVSSYCIPPSNEKRVLLKHCVLCAEPKSASKLLVMWEENGKKVGTGKYTPAAALPPVLVYACIPWSKAITIQLS